MGLRLSGDFLNYMTKIQPTGRTIVLDILKSMLNEIKKTSPPPHTFKQEHFNYRNYCHSSLSNKNQTLPGEHILRKRRHHTCCFIHLRGIIYFLILSLNVHWMDRRIRDKQYSAPKNNSARYSRGIIKNRYNRTDRQNSQNHYFDNFSNYPYIRTRVLLSNTNSSHLFSPLLHCRVRIQNRKTQSKPIQPINIRRNPKTHSSPYCHPPFRSTYLCPPT